MRGFPGWPAPAPKVGPVADFEDRIQAARERVEEVFGATARAGGEVQTWEVDPPTTPESYQARPPKIIDHAGYRFEFHEDHAIVLRESFGLKGLAGYVLEAAYPPVLPGASSEPVPYHASRENPYWRNNFGGPLGLPLSEAVNVKQQRAYDLLAAKGYGWDSARDVWLRGDEGMVPGLGEVVSMRAEPCDFSKLTPEQAQMWGKPEPKMWPTAESVGADGLAGRLDDLTAVTHALRSRLEKIEGMLECYGFRA